MTREEIMALDMEGIEARKAQIREEIEAAADHAALDALDEELNAIEERVGTIKAETDARKADMAKVATGSGKSIEKAEERNKMTDKEIRNSKEYIEAFARYIKTEKDAECRAILSANGYTAGTDDGPVPVPEYLEGRIRTNWEKSQLMNLVRKTYLRGNVKIGFELSASDASVHTEGAAAPDPETLTIGTVQIIPASIKKWVKISDEAVDLGGEEFLNYIYDELTYRIAKYAEDTLLGLIADAPTTATASAVSVAELSSDGTDLLGVVAKAFAHISDEAANPAIVMNKLTYAEFRAAQNGAEYFVDPFEGFPVYFNNTLGTIGNSDGDPWLIVGDFGLGAMANFPNGDEIRIKYDDLSLAEADMVKIVGREYVGLGLVADKAFCRVVSAT